MIEAYCALYEAGFALGRDRLTASWLADSYGVHRWHVLGESMFATVDDAKRSQWRGCVSSYDLELRSGRRASDESSPVAPGLSLIPRSDYMATLARLAKPTKKSGNNPDHADE